MKPRVIIIEYHLVTSSDRREDIVTYRYFETVSCHDQLLRELSSQLHEGGLGSLSLEGRSNGDASLSDLLVELRNLEYGRSLLHEWVRDNQIQIEQPIMPRRWVDYRCDEYFTDGWWNPAKYDPGDDLEVIHDYTRVYEDLEHEFLAVASPGCDGIGFGFRKQHAGLWVYYPMENDFELKAPTIAELRSDWCDGKLYV